MTTRTRLTTALAAVVLLMLAVFVACGLQVDRYEVHYPTIFQARAEEAVERGWIPDWIPDEATDLREVHDPNGTAALLRATLPADVASPEICTPASSIAEPVLRADWFPDRASTLGPPLQCDDWVGVRDDDALLLWRP